MTLKAFDIYPCTLHIYILKVGFKLQGRKLESSPSPRRQCLIVDSVLRSAISRYSTPSNDMIKPA